MGAQWILLVACLSNSIIVGFGGFSSILLLGWVFLSVCQPRKRTAVFPAALVGGYFVVYGLINGK